MPGGDGGAKAACPLRPASEPLCTGTAALPEAAVDVVDRAAVGAGLVGFGLKLGSTAAAATF